MRKNLALPSAVLITVLSSLIGMLPLVAHAISSEEDSAPMIDRAPQSDPSSQGSDQNYNNGPSSGNSDAPPSSPRGDDMSMRDGEMTLSDLQNQLQDGSSNPPPFISNDQIQQNQAAPDYNGYAAPAYFNDPSAEPDAARIDLMQTSGQQLSIPQFQSE